MCCSPPGGAVRTWAMAGVRLVKVIPRRAIQAARRPGVPISSGEGTQRVPPRQREVKRSRCNGSWASPES